MDPNVLLNKKTPFSKKLLCSPKMEGSLGPYKQKGVSKGTSIGILGVVVEVVEGVMKLLAVGPSRERMLGQ